MNSQSPKKILLFIQKKSVYFSTDVGDFKKIISTLGKIAPFEVEVIDATANPELAEKYKIEALPTLIIGHKRYIGSPSAEKAMEIFKKNL
jgi:hypothetical protein